MATTLGPKLDETTRSVAFAHARLNGESSTRPMLATGLSKTPQPQHKPGRLSERDRVINQRVQPLVVHRGRDPEPLQDRGLLGALVLPPLLSEAQHRSLLRTQTLTLDGSDSCGVIHDTAR